MTAGSADVGTLYIDILARLDSLEQSLREAERRSSEAGGRAGDAFGSAFSDKAKASSQQFMGILMGLGAAAGAAGVGLVKMAGDMEMSQAAFTTLLGSGEKAKAFLADLANFAANTPFEFSGLQDSAKKLLAFGFTAQQIRPMLTAVGDAVGSLGGGKDVLDGVTMALGQMQAKGKVSAEEMNQMAERGIPAWDMLAKKIGVSIPEAMNRAAAGQISAAQAIPAILQGMEDKFGGGMEAQSKTLLGMWSNTMDTMQQASVAAGQAIVEALNLKSVLGQFNDFLGQIPAQLRQIDLKAWAKNNQDAIVAVAGALTAALLPALVEGAVAAAAFIAPLLPLMAAGAAIALVLKSMGVGLDDIRAGFNNAMQQAAPFLNLLQQLGHDAQLQFMPVFSMLGEAAKAGFEAVRNVVQNVLYPVFQAIAPYLQPLLASVGNLVREVAATIRDVFTGIRDVVDRILIPAFQAIWPVIKPVLDIVMGGVQTFIDFLSGLFHVFRDALNGDWGKAWEDLKATTGKALTSLNSVLEKAWDSMKSAGLNLGKRLVEGLSNGLNGLKAALLDKMADALAALEAKMPEFMKGTIERAAGAARAAAQAARENIQPNTTYAGIGPRQTDTPRTQLPTVQGVHDLEILLGLGQARTGTPYGRTYFGNQVHNGEDLFAKTGTDILAPFTGMISTRWSKTTGHIIELIDAQGQKLLLGHLDHYAAGLEEAIQKAGGKLLVQQGQVIGAVGQTGSLAHKDLGPGNSHIHMMAYTPDGKIVDPKSVKFVPIGETAEGQQAITHAAKISNQVGKVPVTVPLKPKVEITAKDIQAEISAKLKGIQVRLTLGEISTSEARKAIQLLADDTRQKGRAATGDMKTAYAGAVDSVSAALKSLDSHQKQAQQTTAKTQDVLGDLAREFEYVGPKGLKTYTSGLQAYIAQQEKVVASTQKGSQAHKDAMDAVTRARGLLADVTKKAETVEKETDLQRDQRLRREAVAHEALTKSIKGSTDSRLQAIVKEGVTTTNSLEKINLAEAELERRRTDREGKAKKASEDAVSQAEQARQSQARIAQEVEELSKNKSQPYDPAKADQISKMLFTDTARLKDSAVVADWTKQIQYLGDKGIISAREVARLNDELKTLTDSVNSPGFNMVESVTARGRNPKAQNYGFADQVVATDTDGVAALPTRPVKPKTPLKPDLGVDALPTRPAKPSTFAPTPEQARGEQQAIERLDAWNAMLESQRLDDYKTSLGKMTEAQLNEAIATAKAHQNSLQYGLLLDEQKKRADDAAKNLETLAAARVKLAEAQGKGTGKFDADIAALEKMRGKPGVLASELDSLIAAYQRLAKQDALEQQINKWGDYAKQIIPVVASAMTALGGTADDVASQWAEDMTSMASDLVSFGTAIAKGNWVGAAVQALTTIFGWFSRNKKAAQEAAKATADYNAQFNFSANGYGTRDVTKYTTGALFWKTDHYKAQVDEVGKALAQSLESGFTSGMENGFNEAIKMNDFSLFEKSLTESVGQAVLKGLIDAFMQEEVLKNIIGPRIKAVIDASHTDDGGVDDAREAINLKNAVGEATNAAQTYYDTVLKPIAETFGQLGSGLKDAAATSDTSTVADASPKTVNVTLPSATANFNFDVLQTLAGVVERAAPRIESGGQAMVEGGGRLLAAMDRLERLLSGAELKPTGSYK